MKRVVTASFIFIALFTLLAGDGSNKDKVVFIDWLQSIKKENTNIYIVDLTETDDDLLAKTLTEEEIQTFTDMLAETSVDDIAPDENPFELPSMRYGVLLNHKEKRYEKEFLQLVSPDGDFKITYLEKDWLIKNEDLGEFVLSFFDNEQ